MNKLTVIALFLLAYFSSNAQGILQYKNLKQVSFPSKIDSMDVKGVKVFYSITSESFYECLASPSDEPVDQKRSYRQLQEYSEGFFSSETWKYFKREQLDTTIGGVKGIMVPGYEPSNPNSLRECFNFFTLIDGTYFVIIGAVRTELTPDLKRDIDHYLNSIRFE